MTSPPPDSPRAESIRPDPPELVAFDQRAAAVGEDLHERISFLTEETRAVIRLQVEGKNQILDAVAEQRVEVGELRHDVAGAKVVAGEARAAALEARDEARQYEVRRRADAQEAAGERGLLLRELAEMRKEQKAEREARERALQAESQAREKADSIHEEKIDQVGKKTEAVEKKADALAVVKPWLVGGAKLGAQGGLTAIFLKLLDVLFGG